MTIRLLIADDDNLIRQGFTMILNADTYAGQPTNNARSVLDVLTAREQEVFAELAAGLTDKEIAARLLLSETTVKTRVVGILAKLDLRDRVQAVVFAYEHGVARPRP